jgi:hypothetical protein
LKAQLAELERDGVALQREWAKLEAEYKQAGFHEHEVTGYRSGANAEYQQDSTGGKGFKNAVRAYRKSQEEDLRGGQGVEPTYDEMAIISAPADAIAAFRLGAAALRMGYQVARQGGGYILRRQTGRLSKALLASKETYPGSLNRTFTGSFDELTKDLKAIDPSFKGFKGNVDLPEGVHARYNDATRTIEFGKPLHKVSRGMTAEEVRHFLDEAELGVSRTQIVKAYEAETGKAALFNARNVYNWLHRRVFVRMIHDVESGHPVMKKILNNTDIESLYTAYRQGAYGRKDLNWILRHRFDNPYHSAPISNN